MTDKHPSRNGLPPRVAVVGCGHWGQNHVRNFHRLGALAAIVDADAGRVAELSKEYRVPGRAFSDVLGDAAIDAVVIAAPAKEHGALARSVLDAGKHVLVEKPLALDVAEAEEICRIAEAKGLVLMVGHLVLYHPGFLALERMVKDGRLGRLQYIYSNRLNLGKFRREENILWSFAPHDISMILALTGDLPSEVVAIGACYLHKTIADVTTTHLKFDNGVNAHVFVSWLHPFKEQKLVVIGDRGMVVFDDRRPWTAKLQFFPHSVDWRDGIPVPNMADAQPIPLEECEPLTEECRHFLNAVADGTRPRTDGAEGLNVLRVLDAAERSMALGAPIPLTDASGRSTMPPSGWKSHATACIDAGVIIGEGTQIWHFSHILSGSVIGRDCSIGQNVMIGPDVRIGDRCKIQNNVSLYKGVELEDGVFCGPSCVFTNVMTPRAEVNRKNEFLPTHVERGASIGANATIVCGTRLGDHCLIAAGAVVTKDVQPHALMAGVPARRIGWVSHSGDRLGADLVCPRTGRRYQEIDGGLVEIVDRKRRNG